MIQIDAIVFVNIACLDDDYESFQYHVFWHAFIESLGVWHATQ